MNAPQSAASANSEIVSRIRSQILAPLGEIVARLNADEMMAEGGLRESLELLYQNACGSFERAARMASIKTLDEAWESWRGLLDEFAKRGGQYEMTRLGDIPVLGIPAVRQINLAVREALVNALRHAQAQRIEMVLAPWQAGFGLTIADDGRGISADAAQGVGMNSMRRRLDLLGGEMLIYSQGGTTIEFRIPGGIAIEPGDDGKVFSSYLHDELGQDLTAAAMCWEIEKEAIADFQLKVSHDRYQSLLRDLAVKVRELSHELEDC